MLIVTLAVMLSAITAVVFWVSGGIPVMTGWYRTADAMTQQMPINDPQYMYTRALEYQHDGEEGMAQAAARRATIIDPGYMPAHKFLIAEALKGRDFEAAASESRKVLQNRPDDGETALGLAVAYENMGQKDRAEEIYRDAMNSRTFNNMVRDRARENLEIMMQRRPMSPPDAARPAPVKADPASP